MIRIVFRAFCEPNKSLKLERRNATSVKSRRQSFERERYLEASTDFARFNKD